MLRATFLIIGSQVRAPVRPPSFSRVYPFFEPFASLAVWLLKTVCTQGSLFGPRTFCSLSGGLSESVKLSERISRMPPAGMPSSGGDPLSTPCPFRP